MAGLVLGKGEAKVNVILAYAALAPNLLVIPSFYLMLSQRRDMMRMGSYRRVFLEEQDRIEGWETRLEKFRVLVNKEANDPVPWIIWAVFAASAALFIFVVLESRASLYHLLVLLLPVAFITSPHCKWKRVVAVELPEHVKVWRKVASGKKSAPKRRRRR